MCIFSKVHFLFVYVVAFLFCTQHPVFTASLSRVHSHDAYIGLTFCKIIGALCCVSQCAPHVQIICIPNNWTSLSCFNVLGNKLQIILKVYQLANFCHNVTIILHYHRLMWHDNTFSCICLSRLLSDFGSRPRNFIFWCTSMLLAHVESSSYIKIIGPRTRSQVQKIFYLSCSGFNSWMLSSSKLFIIIKLA